MRVIAGRARRIPLVTPEGMSTRPTTDRIKETLFNMIQGELPSCIFVDLYAGSGGIGIEAISRGASRAYFCEMNPKAISCIRENLKKTRFVEEARVLSKDCLEGIKEICRIESHIDIIFMDPPYDKEEEKRILLACQSIEAVDENTLIIVEASKDTSFDYLNDSAFEVEKVKSYGSNKHVFVRKTGK